MIEWLAPARPSNIRQTKEEEEAGRRVGRELPTAEILQPALDTSLARYQPRKDIKLSGNYKGAVSDTLPALAKLWIEGLKKYYPNVKITIPTPYDGSLGAKALVKGNVDFAIISRVLKPDDMADFKAKFGYDPLSVPISVGSYRHFGFLDAMGFLVYKDNPLETINFDQLDAIYSGTRYRGGAPITTWGQLGLTGEWSDKPINLYGIRPWDGLEELIRQRVLTHNGKRGEWRDGIHLDSIFPMAQLVAGDRYGIGYSGISYLDAGVKVLALGEKEDGPFYPPTYENVARGSYPIERLIFFNTNKEPGKPLNPVLEEFVRFILSREGQQIVLDLAIFLPLRSPEATNSEALILGRKS
jgi:phosphate transport system substrate-binding protein